MFDLEHYAPEEPESFGLLVQTMIGPKNQAGEESFDFLVCSPQWLVTRVPADEYLFGRHHLFLARYDYAIMRRAIQTLRAGDAVLAEDPKTGIVEAEAVSATIQDPSSPLIAVDLSDGSAITVTADHPFWADKGAQLAGSGWLAAGHLRPR